MELQTISKTKPRQQPALVTRRLKVDFKRNVLVLILLTSILRLLVAAVLELGNDEAYYWLFAQHLQWNYFDHPPMVAIWVRLFTFNLALDGYELFVRLGSILSCALSTWFVYKATSILHSRRAGWFAAVLYNTSFYASLVAGLLIMPDSPQMLFWTCCMWMIARIGKDDVNWNNWILFGISAGLCIMSKVHGIFLWIGIGSYIIFLKRQWLRLPQLYVAVGISACIASPILIWNIQNDFVTYAYHSQRVSFSGATLNARNFLNEAGGEFLFNNPMNVVLTILGIAAVAANKLKNASALKPYLFIGLPLIFILLFTSAAHYTLPHWCGPAYVSLLPVAAVWVAEKNRRPVFPISLRLALASMLVFVIGWLMLINYYPGTFGSTNKMEYGKGDVTLDRYGWSQASSEFSSWYKDEVSSGQLPANTPVVCNTGWAAHVEYYFCRPLHLNMVGLGDVHQIHHYAWLNEFRKKSADLSHAICIIPADESSDIGYFNKYYSYTKLAKIIQINRNGKPAHQFYVYTFSGFMNTVD